ncbi:MAG TPA: hypothetical protein PKN65_10750, partial [Tenuifilaceae bacterium]|nr:hypothetical protein [Tenuifilaceae bacterium]
MFVFSCFLLFTPRVSIGGQVYEQTVNLQDTTRLPYPIKSENFLTPATVRSPLFLNQPSNVTEVVEYDPTTKKYTVYQRVGGYNVGLPRVMSDEEYQNYRVEQSMREYWRQKQTGETVGKGDG